MSNTAGTHYSLCAGREENRQTLLGMRYLLALMDFRELDEGRYGVPCLRPAMSTRAISRRDAIADLGCEPLRNLVLLKQLIAYPDHVAIFRAAGPKGTATMVVLDILISAYDRQAYPRAACAAFVSSDHPGLSAALLDHVPCDAGIVFKLASDAAPVAEICRRAAHGLSVIYLGSWQPPVVRCDGDGASR